MRRPRVARWLVTLAVVIPPSSSRAADVPATRLQLTRLVEAPALDAPRSSGWRLDPRSGWALRYARDLEWNQTEGRSHCDGIESQSPRPGSTLATALTRVVTRGLPVVEGHRDLRTRHRHTLLGYFKTKGVSVAWRIEF